jgi:hypothetical protein
MIILINDNKKIIGYEEFRASPEPRNYSHIIIDDETIITQLKEVLGYVQLDENNQLPNNWYEDALLLKNVELIESTYRSKLTEVHSNADAFTTEYLQRYSSVEKETWSTQRNEVNAWQLDNSVPTPKLDQLANARGIERIVFIQKVIDAINTLEELSFQVVAAQQAKEDELLTAKQTSLEALNAVNTTLTI